jgi:hypothetical protein
MNSVDVLSAQNRNPQRIDLTTPASPCIPSWEGQRGKLPMRRGENFPSPNKAQRKKGIAAEQDMGRERDGSH